MGKAEKGTPKDVAKRMKSKGLQKLRFWCEMCQKQCRDANGFKCHMTSETHLRNMKLFSENSGRILSQNSKEFEKSYLDSLKRHGQNFMNANNVYQEVIRNKEHVHMNATCWTSLAGFVKYLGKTGKCLVEENERGWYVQYIDRDITKLARQETMERRQEAELQAEQALTERIEKQRLEAAKAYGGDQQPETSKLSRSEDDAIVKVALKKKAVKRVATQPLGSVFGEDDDGEEEEEEEKPPSAPPPPGLSQQPKKKPKREEPNTWLYEGILARIINDTHAMFRKKVVVEELVGNGKVAFVRLDDDRGTKTRLEVRQADLDTVVAKVGEKVRILKGEYRGKRATVQDLEKKKYRAELRLKDGTVLERVDFENFSKLA
jgi:DNA/RNA-binding protein KIN17